VLDNFGCTKCGLCKNRKNLVNGFGPKDAKIVVVGEGPGLQEDARGLPFVGPSGLLLRRMMQQAGIDYREIYFTNIVRCLPKSEDPKKQVRAPTYEEMDICTPFLEQELNTIKPTIIVPAGNVALRYFLEQKNKNITSHRGLEIWSEKYKCKIMPIYHPAAVIRNPKFESVTIQDLIRINNSQTSKNPTPLGLGDYVVVDTKEKLVELFQHLSTQPEIAFDLETTDLDWLTSDIISIGFSWKERTAWCLPLLKSKIDPAEPTTRFWDDATHLKVMSELKRVFALPSKKIAHNSKFDQKFLITNGIEVNNLYFDTMLIHHLLDENAEGLHGLKDLAWVYTDMGGYAKEVDDFFAANKKLSRQFIMLPFSILTKYNAADADCTFRIFKKFEPLVHQQGLNRLYRQVVSPAREVLLHAELDGVQVDQIYVDKLREEYTYRKGLLEKDIFKLTGPFNINSPLELRSVLYDKLKFKSSKQTKKGALSTDREALANIAKAYPKHLVPKFLLEYRECTKMLSTFINGLSRHIDKNGRVHSTYKQHGTVTGRLSSSEPNLQNIPRESTIRGIFVANPGYTLVEADYGQAEFRFWAFYSQDPQMIYDLKSGQDIHKMTAASAWGVPLDKVTKTQRQNAKAIVFGLMYGRGTWSVAQQLGIPEEEAEKIVEIFFGRYPIAKRWLKNQVQLAKRQGYVTNYFGRIRRLPGINSNDNMVQSEAERQAKNSPIQSGASDMTCVASIRIKKRLAAEGLKAKLVLTVHDSLVYECLDAEVDKTINIIKEETERPIGEINVPMICELKKGQRWGFLEVLEVLV